MLPTWLDRVEGEYRSLNHFLLAKKIPKLSDQILIRKDGGEEEKKLYKAISEPIGKSMIPLEKNNYLRKAEITMKEKNPIMFEPSEKLAPILVLLRSNPTPNTISVHTFIRSLWKGA